MIKEVLYATNNPGKVIEVSKLLNHNGISVVSPKDLGIDLDIAETGSSLEENAQLKATGFLALSAGRIVLSDDTGLEIDALGGQPGIHVRRWKDGVNRMEDEEIIEYCLQLLAHVPTEKRGAQFKTVLCLALPSGNLETFDGVLRGRILEQPAEFRIAGFPFESLFYVNEWQMLMGEAHKLNPNEKGDRINHRELALTKAIPRIREILAQ